MAKVSFYRENELMESFHIRESKDETLWYRTEAEARNYAVKHHYDSFRLWGKKYKVSPPTIGYTELMEEIERLNEESFEKQEELLGKSNRDCITIRLDTFPLADNPLVKLSVNWASIGAVDADKAIAYAECITYAAKLTERCAYNHRKIVFDQN